MASNIVPLRLIALIYGGGICVIILVLRLLSRFVSAHERVAGVLETIARKSPDDARP